MIDLLKVFKVSRKLILNMFAIKYISFFHNVFCLLYKQLYVVLRMFVHYINLFVKILAGSVSFQSTFTEGDKSCHVMNKHPLLKVEKQEAFLFV